jgi:hypothetical protein
VQKQGDEYREMQTDFVGVAARLTTTASEGLNVPRPGFGVVNDRPFEPWHAKVHAFLLCHIAYTRDAVEHDSTLTGLNCKMSGVMMRYFFTTTK